MEMAVMPMKMEKKKSTMAPESVLGLSFIPISSFLEKIIYIPIMAGILFILSVTSIPRLSHSQFKQKISGQA
jgi:hypothetical protein